MDRADILHHAYHLVRANKASAGIDGLTFLAIKEGEGVTAFLAKLEAALRNKTHQAEPMKRSTMNSVPLGKVSIANTG